MFEQAARDGAGEDRFDRAAQDHAIAAVPFDLERAAVAFHFNDIV